jgi:hydroxypyruvate isomerase
MLLSSGLELPQDPTRALCQYARSIIAMPKFAANISMLFTELPFMERFAAARAAGFEAVESQFPYDFDAADQAALLKKHGLRQVLHNLPFGDWPGAERGFACHPGREAVFRASVQRAMHYARTLDCPQLNCLSGVAPPGVTAEAARAAFVGNLRFAAAALRREGMRLLTEPINSFDVPGYFLNRTDQALSILDEVGSDNLLVQYDIYHAQRMEGELANTLSAQLARIGHIQVSDNPGRHEPGTGEINFPFLFAHLDAIGYQGWVGAEYRPRAGTREGLGWFDAARSAGAR